MTALPLIALLAIELLQQTPNTTARHTLTLQYSTLGATCPAQGDFHQRVAARLGYVPFDERGTWTAVVDVAPVRGMLLGQLRVTDQAGKLIGSRKLEATVSDCQSLIESLAFALAIAVDPQVLWTSPPQAAPEPAPTPTPAPNQPPPETAPRSPSLRLSVWAGGSGSWAHLPQLGAGPAFGASVDGDVFRFSMLGSLFLAPATTYFSGTIDSSITRGSVEGCGKVDRFGLCVRGGGGAIHVSGSGFANSRRGVLPTAFVGPSAWAEWRPADRWVLRTSLGVDFALVRPTVFVGETEAWTAAPIAVEALFALGWELL